MDNTVYVYTLPICATCTAVKVYFAKHGIVPEVRELTDEVRAEFDPHKHFTQAPIVVFHGQAHGGFRIDRLQEIVRKIKEAECSAST